MVNFQCAHCECTYKHRKTLLQHRRSKHAGIPIETNSRGASKSTGSTQYLCHHCGNKFSRRDALDRHAPTYIRQ